MKQTFAKNISAAAIIIAACAITACSNSSGSVPFLPSAVGINSGTGTGQGGGSQAGLQDTATNEGLRNYLVGTWTCSDNGFSGVITLNSDGSGHIDVKRSNGDIVHNRDFTWTACVGMMASKILEISGTNEGALDGEHSITTSADSFN
ncbi:MAG: hypothetical protein K5917_06380 [Clostridiales bacterium]|nr:hypothetical protein [Clostridiales bacterium]